MMKQEISPWSIYDKNFAEKPKSKHENKVSKTIDYSDRMDKIYDVDVLDNDSIQLKKVKNRQRKSNKTDLHIDKLQKFNNLTHQKTNVEKHLLGERHKEIIILKIIRQQLYREQRQENQKNIVKNIIQFKDPVSEHLQFPKINKHNHSVLLMPEPIKNHQMKRYMSRMDMDRSNRNNSGLQFNDQKLLEKNIQLLKSKSKQKKLANLLLYNL